MVGLDDIVEVLHLSVPRLWRAFALGPPIKPNMNRTSMILPGTPSAMCSIASKIGCTPETLRSWVRRVETDQGQRAGMSTDERERLKTLERENKELRRANEILKTASAFFAQAELDRKLK